MLAVAHSCSCSGVGDVAELQEVGVAPTESALVHVPGVGKGMQVVL
jgi:hypothetical protein